MNFQLPEVTQVQFVHANVRRELHGEEHVRAVDIRVQLTGENTLLDLIEPGLREHHFFNKALLDGQAPLPNVIVPLPNLRFPLLPTVIEYARKKRYRGYRFVQDFGMGAEAGSNLDFTDCVLASFKYEIIEGGSCKIWFTVQFNGDDLNDDALYGRCAGLATEGEGHIQVFPPATLSLATKGYRSGRPDTPAEQVQNEAQQEIDADEAETLEGAESDSPFPPGSPVAALASSVEAGGD